MVKAVAYTRVSTNEQNPQSQLQVVLDYIEQRGYELVKVFEEHCTGAIPPLNRPVFKEMLKSVKENGVEVIVLYDLTRFYRGESPVRALQMIREIMDDYNILIEFAREPEIEDPLLKELWLFIKSWFSTYERLQISLRTTYGLRRLKQEGKLYHKPSIVHYYASAIFGKDLAELTKEEVERAREKSCKSTGTGHTRRLKSVKYWHKPNLRSSTINSLTPPNLTGLSEEYY